MLGLHNSQHPAAASLRIPPQRILVIITRRIGDVLLSTPLIHSLKLAWPNSEIDTLVFANTASVLTGNPDITRIITIPERPSAIEHLKFFTNIWHKYDLSISTLSGDRPTIYAWAAGKYRVGLLENKSNQYWKRILLDAWLPFDNEQTHTIAMYLAIAKSLNILPSTEVILKWNEPQAKHIRQLIDIEKPYAVLHIYPKFSYKMWHEQGWIELAKWLESQGLQLILTGSPAADEMAYIANIFAKFPANSINLAGKLDLGATAYLLKQAKIYVGPDTSISHIAAAMGTPSVALFGPSNPVKWGPWPRGQALTKSPFLLKGTQTVGNVTIIQGHGLKNSKDCVPCFEEGCERHIDSSSECLQSLTAATVIEAVKKLLITPELNQTHV
jgi:heptosyltransferase-3